jgi:hypothetical protein
VLVRAAVPGDGIHSFSEDLQTFYKELFVKDKKDLELLKFVPASGAATRMFKTLLKLYHENGPLDDAFVARQAGDGNGDYIFFQEFVEGLKESKFAFIQDLSAALAGDGLDFSLLLEKQKYRILIEYLLMEKGLNYANLPKALLQFHNDPDGSRSSLEEQFREALAYALSGSNVARLHFTVSREFVEAIEAFSETVCQRLAGDGAGFEVGFSVQSPATDTVAVDLGNQPLMDENGRLVFRPGGHGALIENLDALDADVIFIKNIDNVVPDHLKKETLVFQEILGGFLLDLRGKVHGWMRMIEDRSMTVEIVREIAVFLADNYLGDVPEGFFDWPDSRRMDWLSDFLDRPIRVCGMVKNLGEPGGGPFWVAGEGNRVSLQIVEKAQVDCGVKDQKDILESSTHFNPVILVCCTKNFKGEKYALKEFIDPDTYFISEKSINGKPLKALEHPGLWNGAMANWLTVFVEIPASTFTPVKTVNDLLRKEHQPL